METIELKAEERKETGKKVKHLRKKGLIPAVVYGYGFKNVAVSIDSKSYIKTISGDAGTNVIITLDIYDSKKESLPVITHEIQRNPLTDEIIHLDLHKINMKEKITAKIPVEIIGQAIGVKEEGGIMVHSLSDLEIKCLPMDIPDKVEIDVSGLKIGDSWHVSDLKSKLSADVEILTPETETVAQVIPPAKEEEVAPPPLAEGEVPPVEGAVPAEGEAKVEEKAEAKPEAPKKA